VLSQSPSICPNGNHFGRQTAVGITVRLGSIGVLDRDGSQVHICRALLRCNETSCNPERLPSGSLAMARVEHHWLPDFSIDHDRCSSRLTIHHYQRIVIGVSVIRNRPVHSRRKIILNSFAPSPNRCLVGGVRLSVYPPPPCPAKWTLENRSPPCVQRARVSPWGCRST